VLKLWARVEHEHLQQPVLRSGQLDERLVDHRPVARAVELELLEDDRVGVAVPAAGTAQQGAHPSLQLADVERLDQVVVGARVEAVDAVLDRLPRGEHEDGDPVARGAQAATDLETVDVGKPDVEHHAVG